ncbi:MAG: META domain-containing protein [Flavobacteriales bacterium AspAUS03]
MRYISSYISILCILFLTNCGGTKNKYPTSIAYGGKWILQDAAEVYANDKKVYISFDPRTSSFRGFAGCNKIRGNYLINDKEIDLFEIITTRKSCKEMKTENTFISLLKRANKIKINPLNLELYKGDILLIRFKRER